MNHPRQVRLAAARKAAKYLQARFRERYTRERDHAATGFQSLWRRYSARCMFAHQLRLGRAAVEVQRMWRGHYIYTRFRVVEKVRRSCCGSIFLLWQGEKALRVCCTTVGTPI